MQNSLERFVIAVFMKNGGARVAAMESMVEAAGLIGTLRSKHGGSLPKHITQYTKQSFRPRLFNSVQHFSRVKYYELRDQFHSCEFVSIRGGTGGLPTSAGALDAINVIEANEANWSIALADNPQ